MSPLLRSKLRVAGGLAVGICLPYFALQQLPALALLPARSLPATPADLAIPFDPRWVWAYYSLGLLVPLAPSLARRQLELQGYVRGLVSLCLPCFALFALFPVAGPRPEAVAAGAAYAWLVSVDAVWNSFPSLHAGLATFSAGFLSDRSRALAPGPRRAVGAGLLLWVGAILYSTLATKQHWLLDLPPGFAFGLLGWHVARTTISRRAGAAEAADRSSSGVTVA